MNLPPNGIHFGVYKEGVLQFIVQRNITYEGDHWELAYPDLNLNTSRDLVDSIVSKIYAYFT